MFSDPDFQARVIEGAKRITKQHAESSFVVGILRGEKTVFPLVYGTAPEYLVDGTSNFQMLGFDGFGAAEVDIFPSVETINQFLRKRDGKRFQAFDEDDERPISVDECFHFHPTSSGFSGHDINEFDEKRLVSKDSDHLFLPKNGYKEGLFFPIFGKRLGKPMSGLGYIAISGKPQNTEYQGAELWRVSPVEQAKLFQRCGFEVSHTVIPVKGGTPHF